MGGNLLCIATYYKGERFIRTATSLGARVYLFTIERLLDRPWPRDVLAEVFAQRDEASLQDTIRTVSYLARTRRFDRIVALDDFDVETAAALREHLRIPGMGETTARHFRDKLAMRVKCKEAGILAPDFVHVLNHDQVREFLGRVPPPWMNKPRSQASASGITKIKTEAQLWEVTERQGDEQSHFLLEQFVPGDVYHVDSIVSEKRVLFSEVHRCVTPPFDVAHGGGVFATHTIERGSPDDRSLRMLNEKLLDVLNLRRGVSHAEFIKGKDDGQFYMLECAARVGGAHITDMIEASTGVNLWEEWAKIELCELEKKPYLLPARSRSDYGGLAMTLAREPHPDTSGFDDPEIVYRSPEAHHVGLVVRSPDHVRAADLTRAYAERLRTELGASMPARDKPAR
jgi:biotin carboxylase